MDIKIDVGQIRIDTPRLSLRAFEEGDLDDFFEYASIDGLGEMAGWKHLDSIEEAKVILDRWLTEKNILAIVSKDDDKAIGSLGFHRSWANDDPEYARLKVKDIGYVLSKYYWGRGLMPEAVEAVIKYCFEALGVDALTVGHFPENLQSKRVIEKCGFNYVKQNKFVSESLNKVFDEKSYILLNYGQR